MGREDAQVELRDALSTVPVDGSTDWNSVVECVQRALGNPLIAGLYSIEWDGKKAVPGLAVISQTSRARALAHIEGLIAQRELTYDPLNVAVHDQNRALTVEDLIRQGHVTGHVRVQLERVGQRLRGVKTPAQLRAIVTEGSTMLGWVGAMSDDPEAFGPSQTELLRSFIPLFQRRLLVEQRLTSAPLRAATLDAALEALTEPAFVVTESGRPVLMNSGARALWEADRLGTTDDLVAAMRGHGQKFRVTTIAGAGVPPHRLLIRHAKDTASRARLHHAAKAWALTMRESEVLLLVAEGRTNAAIARDLACAERTVELHITHLLQKARVTNRATLVAHFWTGRSA